MTRDLINIMTDGRAALDLKSHGLSVRDPGRVLGVSHQRAGQLTSR